MTAPDEKAETDLDKMNDLPRARRRVVEAPRRPPVELCALRVVVEEDPDPDVSYLDQEDFEERKNAYERGEFGFVGVRAEADVVLAETTQTLVSPGLWGIEDDSGLDEIERVAQEEWSVLRDVLKDVGIPTDKLPLEIDRERFEWRT